MPQPEESPQGRESFAHRPRWGAKCRSRELQAAPWLTRGPGGAIRRGRVVVREKARSCEHARDGRDSLFAKCTSWRPEMRVAKWGMAAETLSFVARVGELVDNTGLLGGQVGRVSDSLSACGCSRLSHWASQRSAGTPGDAPVALLNSRIQSSGGQRKVNMVPRLGLG